ncbi:MAG: UDP-N-acetylmuramate dehydrogenase [Egibacteraceae bacterium]
MADDPLLARLRERVAGAVLPDEAMARHTTLRVGGPARVLLRAESAADLVATAQVCADEGVRWLILGRGSNLLVSDQGWNGVVVKLGRAFRGIEIDGERVVAGAAEPMPVLAQAVAAAELGGLAFGVAIPGSLGGAVRMNAGAHGHELREVLKWVEVVRLDRDGLTERLPAAALRMTYRHSELPADAVALRAGLSLQRTDPAALEESMAEMRRWRREHQPLGEPSCGSVFRNPPGDSAGRLIEAAGLKAHHVGGAQVSPRHANFITVTPGARAHDVAQVIADVTQGVAQRFSVTLETEVVMAGFDEVRSTS